MIFRFASAFHWNERWEILYLVDILLHHIQPLSNHLIRSDATAVISHIAISSKFFMAEIPPARSPKPPTQPNATPIPAS